MEKNNLSVGDRISDPATWVAQYGDYLYRFTLTRICDQVIAEDLVQETFLAALKARHNFAGQSSEQTWLVGILKKKIVDHFRRVSREIDFEKIDDLPSEWDADYELSGRMAGWWKADRRPADWNVDDRDPVERKEFWDFLQQCLDSLHPRTAIMFVLREMEEMNSKEVCNILRLTPTNLRVMLYRARKDLRRCLEENWIGGQRKQ
jgi:RNA polymerase sigma-70 factor (TIGR02943 family)